MDYRKQDTREKRKVAAVSRATYRKVDIMVTEKGVSFFFGSQRYDCFSLPEATALIDAIYAQLAHMLN